MTFADRLKDLRKRAGLTEKGLAAASGVAEAALHSYAVGYRHPSAEAVFKLAKALGVTCDAFAGCTFPPTPSQTKPARRPARKKKR